MKKYGLIGFPLGHSFSKKYFTSKFEKEGIDDCRFDLYEIPEITQFPDILSNNPELKGLSVTIPYKEKVIPYLDFLDPACKQIGAVNCIQIRERKLTGFNTDYIGFKNSLEKWLGNERPNALVLGTGGASKAVVQALKDLHIDHLMVSRTASDHPGFITYQDLKEKPGLLSQYHLIINTTPLGTYPNTEEMPEIDPAHISGKHKVYDLVYNPEKTFLMRSLEARGALVKNGLEMLELQAEAAWKIWN
ncbi:Shikimate 5-dehydrogenase I alpha [Indibacter alkaliphilus LW1]|uniref:Shikimate 5-dehydrogenase I alpha n=1 Tax=Indibacter alkaliphilus (strain CCUG 57479 / KCTC 22604 / LW1) TaxID=1189612 RepID=S2DX58_INDAL|nr:shikimate dehydrogenase [Indibacter alkaliphilus]EOZ96666.1 Shikimate 5-dehydrogenase I alpha [Indibacter alkaliphilus LW1]